MKNILLTLTASLLACIFAGDLKAQDKTYLPMLEIGKEWTFISYQINGEQSEPNEPFGGRIVETIQENGHEVFIFYPLYKDFPTDPNMMKYHINKAYEEDGALWFFSSEDGDYVPMIDFNLEVGDPISEIEEVAWKGSVVIEGTERCVMAIQNSSSRIVDYWVEGIGAMSDTYISAMPSHCGLTRSIVECRMSDSVLFDINHMDDYLSLADVKTLTSKNEETTPIYDLYGRRISTPAAGQLYIQGGKKYIAR